MTDRPDDLSPAGELFARFLELQEDGEAPPFADYCREHTAHAEELERLHARWQAYLAPLDESIGGPPPHAAASVARAAELLEQVPREQGASKYDDRGAFARGGMGEIRSVWDRVLRRTLAMKVLRDGRGSEGSRGLARFLDEARISAQLDHPGIVPVHELGLDGSGRVYYTMPLIRGQHLGEVFERARGGDAEWTHARVLGVLQRVCEAIAFAHSRGVVHRDLKPANVMVGPFGETYVMDWGLAKVLSSDGDATDDDGPRLDTERLAADTEADDSSLWTVAGSVVGTPAYIAPEQAAGATIDGRADVYSIGAMLYELLTGRKPYADETTRTPVALLAALGAGPPAPLRRFAPETPPELEAICERAMAYRPEERYADVVALAGDLRAFVEGRVVQAYETGAWAEARKWVTRNRATAVAAAAALLLAVAGSTAVALSESSRRTQVEDRNQQLEVARQEQARQTELARQRADEVLRLSDQGIVTGLEERALSLWPLRADRAAEIEQWLADADALIERTRADHRPKLTALREQAQPYDDSQRDADDRRQPSYAEREYLVKLEGHRQMILERAAAKGPPADEAERQRQQAWEDDLASIQAKLAAIRALPFERMTWIFETPELQWEHDTLEDLVGGVDRLTAEGGLLGEVRGARDELRRVVEESVEGPRAVALWREAIEAVADAEQSPLYGGLEIEPQFGLLPLGPDPESGLWEFAHLLTGEAPTRDPDTGALSRDEAQGVVLVLIPGGTAFFGAQADFEDRLRYEPNAAPEEGPVYRFLLDPYFIAKHEFTQGQWLRATGSNPSDFAPGRRTVEVGDCREGTLLNPVERVNWSTSKRELERLGLTLPTEAQWEFAARGGTDGPFYFGIEFGEIEGHENIGDETLARTGRVPDYYVKDRWLEDGFGLTAPVGSLLPNPYGLHDVLGNVGEWTLDDHLPHSDLPRRGDGLRVSFDIPDVTVRGGDFFVGLQTARATSRRSEKRDMVGADIGFRAARRLE